MSTEAAAPIAADKGAFAGTPIRDLIAGATAFGVVVIGANILAHTLKGVMDDTVRNGAVGVLFASVPAVYGVVRKVVAGIGPQPAKPAPELAPWYITGMLAGVILFAWTRLVSLLVGVGFAGLAASLGQTDPSLSQALAQGFLSVLAVLLVPTLLVVSVLAGYSLHKNTRSLSILAILLAVIVLVGSDAIMTFFIFRDLNMNLIQAARGGAMPMWQWLFGFGIFAAAALLGMLIGMWSAMLRKERSVSGIASLAKRLSASDREAVDTDLRERILAARAAKG